MPILPDSNVLKKLKDADPLAAQWVFDRFEIVGKERMRREPLIQRSFWEGVTDAFSAVAGKPLRYTFSQTAWEAVGNDLRKSIKDYCEHFPETVKKAGVTDDDLKTLHYPENPSLYWRWTCL